MLKPAAALKVKKGNLEVGKQLLAQTTQVVKEVEKRNKEAERKGLLEVLGAQMATHETDLHSRIEDDVFWREMLPKIDYEKAGEKNAGDVVRSVFGTAWNLGHHPERIEVTVGKTGVKHLDLAQVRARLLSG